MNPKYIKTKTGDMPLEFQTYSDAESYNRDAGFSDAAMHYACLWHVHRYLIDEFNEAFTPTVEKLSGIAREIDEVRTAKRRAQAVNASKVTPVREKFVTYLSRVFAKVPTAVAEEIKLAGLTLSRTMSVSSAPAERKMTIEPMYYKRADSLLLQDLDTINEKVSKFLSLVPDFELERDDKERPLRESLARLCQKYDNTRWSMEE